MSDPEKKGLIIFGRDVSQIPCFRESHLYGISGGIGTGLLYFLFTSNAPRANIVGLGSFGVILIASWVRCRSKLPSASFQENVKKAIEAKMLAEGTALEKKIEEFAKSRKS